MTFKETSKRDLSVSASAEWFLPVSGRTAGYHRLELLLTLLVWVCLSVYMPSVCVSVCLCVWGIGSALFSLCRLIAAFPNLLIAQFLEHLPSNLCYTGYLNVVILYASCPHLSTYYSFIFLQMCFIFGVIYPFLLKKNSVLSYLRKDFVQLN